MAFVGLVALGSAHVDEDTGVPLIQCTNLLGPEDTPENREPFGELAMYQSLGVSAMPAEPTEVGLTTPRVWS